MTRPRITLVVNPASNKGTAADVADAVAEQLRTGASVRVLSGSSEAETVFLLARAAEDSDAVIVCGGDGTVHLAVNALAQGEVPLGIIPAGTGNDTATALGIPANPVQAAQALLAALLAGSRTRVDLGWCDGRWWVTMLYGGFDSAVNERANALRWPRGKRRYDVAILAELAGLRSRPVRLVLDGSELLLPATLVAIGNGPQYGGGKRMTPTARMDDGIFDITVVGPLSRLDLVRLAPTLPRAGHLGFPAVSRYRAREVIFDAPDTIAYADGERVGPLPITTSCVPAALEVLLPIGLPTPGLSASVVGHGAEPSQSSGTMER